MSKNSNAKKHTATTAGRKRSAVVGKVPAGRALSLAARRYLSALNDLVPPHDREQIGRREMENIAADMSQAAQKRKPGRHAISAVEGAGHTAFVVINDDMPFIIDSLTAEIARQGYHIELLLHPILQVSRDKGVLRAIDTARSARKGLLAESHVYIRLEAALPPPAARDLAATLGQVLDDVRLATEDWQAMLARVDSLIAGKDAATMTGRGQDGQDVAEARDFLSYLRHNNFTFLGYRAYRFADKGGRTLSKAVSGSDLGILKKAGKIYFDDDNGSPEAEALAGWRWPVMVSKLIDEYSTVHRHVPLDVVSIKIHDRDGRLSGMHVFVGLFTSSTYSCRTDDIPIVRRKVRETIEQIAFKPGSHDAKALEHILEKMPRDELLQASQAEVLHLALGIMRLQTKPRVALFMHFDPMKQYMSCLVYVPRDRYNTDFRLLAQRVLESGIHGRITNYFTSLDDSALARILFTMRLDSPETEIDAALLEQQLIDGAREWHERLGVVLAEKEGRAEGAILTTRYGRAFGAGYHESIDIHNAVHDIRHLEQLRMQESPIRLELYRLMSAPAREYRLKVYNRGAPVPLSQILPVLDNMGLKAMDERPFEVRPQGEAQSYWIHDFGLQGPEGLALDEIKANFEDVFTEIWRGRAENDGLNALVLLANLDWREVLMLRSYSNFLRQARFPYSRGYINQVLVSYPAITGNLVSLFHRMHDPRRARMGEAAALAETIEAQLQDVTRLDHDRILRQVLALIRGTLRTNYFQPRPDGAPRSVLAFKLDSRNLPDLPQPRPHVEIFVYSARMEAVHLRGGEIARGGIRWSDRLDDFRTEVLGLLKAQMVKNTVIVPVGAKGGFIVKQPPAEGGRPALQQEAVECYKIFIRAMLDITDNIVKGKVVRPRGVVCHDGPDPYLVVAADKGTATFSDIANSIALDRGFWLGDAFASGGSAGYDHKKMGITARGGWESVKRHFRELGKDIQTEDFTVVGVGDMGGDVFGNAMLLSRHIHLLAAFNHVHIFIDPAPDAAKSYAERQRLFDARGGWDQYDAGLISAGGGVFERSAKKIRLTAEIKRLLGLSGDTATPDEVVQAILRAEADLLWFGGIGTFVKSSRQSHADADDKANDAVRVDGRDLRVKVVGEGANLGVTQQGRIEFATRGHDGKGGRINTDFIDNSAGVDCSDHEVNIKILLADVAQRRRMSTSQRNKLLERMTEDVGRLVLADNYQQTQALSFLETVAADQVGMHAQFLRLLEKEKLVNRSLEGLPDDEGFARLAREGRGLSRPELAVLMSYAKIVLYNEILATDIPDDPILKDMLSSYFPLALRGYETEVSRHKLRREILATEVVNILVNRMGPVFVFSRADKTGAELSEIVRAFLIALHVYDVQSLWRRIEALDNKVPAATQLAALSEIFVTVKRAVTWFLRFGREGLPVGREVARFLPHVSALRQRLAQVLPPAAQAKLAESQSSFEETGLPAELAAEMAVLKTLASAADIVQIAEDRKVSVETVAHHYFTLGETLGFDWLRGRTYGLVTENSWQARVKSAVLDDLYQHQARLTAALLPVKTGKGEKKAAVRGIPASLLAQSEQMLTDIRHQEIVKLEMLVLVTQRFSQMVNACG